MSEVSSGVSIGQVESIVSRHVSALRSELKGDINSLHREFMGEINRLEREMREVAEIIARELREQTSALVSQIEHQTAAVVGGVAANTLVLESTKQQIETDFDKTRIKLDLQTEASLQVEVGKKISDSVSTRGKLDAFATDIKQRFESSIQAFYLNRQLYNVNFKKIFDEYTSKLKTIGEHIFFIRDNDIAPAIEAAEAPLEEIHSLPIEVDLYRLQVRAQSLDQTLDILKSSRFDRVLNSIDSLESKLVDDYAISGNGPVYIGPISNIALVSSSSLAMDILLDGTANELSKNAPIDISNSVGDVALLKSDRAKQYIKNAFGENEVREATFDEITKLIGAARRLVDKKLISDEAADLFEDFLGSGNLKLANKAI